MDCYTNNFPGLPCFKKLTADKHVLAELPLVPFVIINLTRLTVFFFCVTLLTELLITFTLLTILLMTLRYLQYY